MDAARNNTFLTDGFGKNARRRSAVLKAGDSGVRADQRRHSFGGCLYIEQLDHEKDHINWDYCFRIVCRLQVRKMRIAKLAFDLQATGLQRFQMWPASDESDIATTLMDTAAKITT